MDAEICTACGRDIPINEPLTVRDGRVICAYCALAESDASAPAKPPHTPPLEKRKSKPPVALPHSSPRFRPFRQSPGPVAPLPVLWIGIYLTGLVAAIMVVNHAHNHDFGRMITRVSQGAIARAGPCQISVRQCILESLVMVSNGSAERIIVVVRVHNSSSSKAITYKTWRPQEAETGAPPQLGYHREGSRSWYSKFRTAFWGHPASGSVNRLLAANYSPSPGFTWRVCTVPPGGTVYDILQFTAQNTVTGPLTLSLPMSHLGQPGVVLCPIHPTVEFGFSPYKYAMRNRPVIGNFPLDQLAKVPPQTPVAPITDAVIPNLNHAGQSGGVTANVPSSGAPHLTVTPANPATLFNQTGLRNAGALVRRDEKTALLWINEEFSVSLILARCRTTAYGSFRWLLRLESKLAPDLTIAARLQPDNATVLDYYLFPAIDVLSARMRLALDNPLAFDVYRFPDLQFFHYVARRRPVAEVA